MDFQCRNIIFYLIVIFLPAESVVSYVAPVADDWKAVALGRNR